MKVVKPWTLMLSGFAVAALFASRTAAEPIPEKVQEHINKGLEWLKKQQQKDGAWSNNGQNPVSMTGMAGLAMLCEGSTVTQGKYRDNIRSAVDFLVKRSNKGGARHGLIGNPDHPGESGRYMYGHGFAMLFLASAYGEEDDKARREELKEVLTRAVTFCGSAQSTQGGWYYSGKGDPPGSDNDEGSVTVTQMQAIRACRDAGIPVPATIVKQGHEYLRKSTDAQGGVVYSLGRGGGGFPAGGGRPALTAAAIACFFSAGKHDDENVKKWFGFCYNSSLGPQNQKIPLGGPGGGARFGHDEYTHFYYAPSVYFLGEKGYKKMFPKDTGKPLTWSMYRDNFFEGACKNQDQNGCWNGTGSWGAGPIYSTAVYCVIMQLDNNCLPVFQR